MQHPEKPGQITAHELRIGGKGFKGLRGCGKHGFIGYALIGSEEGAELLRNGKCDHEVMAGQLPVELFFHPSAGLMPLADIAVAVAAGKIGDVDPAASGAVLNHHAGISSPAAGDGINGLDMIFGHAIFVLIKVMLLHIL